MEELQKTDKMPVITLRGMTILPYMVIHFDVTRKKTLSSVEQAKKGDQRLFVITQKDPNVIDPEMGDLYEYGTLVEVRQTIKLDNGLTRVLVKGICRARLSGLEDAGSYLVGSIDLCPPAEFTEMSSES